MKLISNPKDLSIEFKRLAKRYDQYLWAVAWADFNFEFSNLLVKNAGKIHKIIIGLKFYGTDVGFLKKFASHPGVKFSQKSKGTFHPKLYLFRNSDQEWELLIGSANFTRSAFSLNTEFMILISSKDQKSQSFYSQMLGSIESEWRSGEIINESFIEQYTSNKKSFIVPRPPSMPTKGRHQVVFSLNWNSYLKKLKKEDYQSRIDLLNWVHRKLRHKEFHLWDEHTRKSIAGFGDGEPTVEIGCFGTTNARGFFKQSVIDKPQIISRALRKIPTRGLVTEENYLEFIKEFKKVSKQNELACATRFLCLWRPDYFVNVNGKNKNKLAKELRIRASQINYDTYWNLVVQPFIESDWKNAKSKLNKKDIKIYENRIALLDCIYYLWE